jgi:hypothetical protein
MGYHAVNQLIIRLALKTMARSACADCVASRHDQIRSYDTSADSLNSIERAERQTYWTRRFVPRFISFSEHFTTSGRWALSAANNDPYG